MSDFREALEKQDKKEVLQYINLYGINTPLEDLGCVLYKYLNSSESIIFN